MLNVKHDFTIHPKAAAPRVFAIGYTLDDVYGSYSIEKLAPIHIVRSCATGTMGITFVSRRQTRSRSQSVSTSSILRITGPCAPLSRAPTIMPITWTSR